MPINNIQTMNTPTINGLSSLTLDELTVDTTFLGNVETKIQTIDEALILNAGAYITTNGYNISDVEISYLSGSSSNIQSQINTNTGNINTNIGNINTNTGNINTNTGNINTNTGNINTNTGNINTNTGNINTNTGDINTNTGNINTNTGDINDNSEDIVTLKENTEGFYSFGSYQGLNKTILSTTSNIGLYFAASNCFLTLGSGGRLTISGENQYFGFTNARKAMIETNTSDISLKQNIINDDNLLDAKFIGSGDVSITEYDFLNGVTNNIQTQLNNKNDIIDINNKLDSSYISTGVVSNAEFNYLDGVTSPIQTQLNSKNESINSGNLLNCLFIGTGIISNATFNFLEGVASNIQLQLNDLNYKVLRFSFDGSKTSVAGEIITEDLKTTTLKFISDSYSDVQNYAFTTSFKNKLDYYILNEFQAVINSYITNFYNKPGGVFLFDYGFTVGTNASRHDGTIDNQVISVYNELQNPGTTKFYLDKIYCFTGNLSLTNIQDIAHLTYYVLIKSGSSTVYVSDTMHLDYDGSETMSKIGLQSNTQYFKSAYDFSGTTTIQIVGDYRCNPVDNGAQFTFTASIVQVGI
jgi:hypothetical protein